MKNWLDSGYALSLLWVAWYHVEAGGDGAKALAILEPLVSGEHDTAIIAAGKQGHIHYQDGRFELAEPLLRRGVLRYALALFDLTELLLHTGRYDPALDLLSWASDNDIDGVEEA